MNEPNDLTRPDGPTAEAETNWTRDAVAVYGLEQPVRCPHCRRQVHELHVVRLYRARVDFVSSLPRSGRLLVCPACRTPIPGELGAVF